MNVESLVEVQEWERARMRKMNKRNRQDALFRVRFQIMDKSEYVRLRLGARMVTDEMSEKATAASV